MKTLLDERLRDPENARLFAEENFVVEVTERLCEVMEKLKVSRAELACRLGTTRANITQMLGGRNVSIRTVAAVAHVLKCKPLFELESLDAGAEEIHVNLFRSTTETWSINAISTAAKAKVAVAAEARWSEAG